MAEAARRTQQAGGSDLVRRMIARPVRLEQQARTRLAPPTVSDLDADAAPADAAPDADLDAGSDGALARLEAQLQVMKAVLRAQRQEVEALRAQRRVLTESDASDDVRATRERWAALVDSLLIRAR